MNEGRPDWYDRLKGDPLEGRGLTQEQMREITKLALGDQVQPGKVTQARRYQVTRLVYMMGGLAAGILVLVVLTFGNGFGGENWWGSWFGGEKAQLVEPSVLPNPSPGPSAEIPEPAGPEQLPVGQRYKLKGSISVFERPEAFPSQNAISMANPDREYELLAWSEDGRFARIRGDDFSSGWIPGWYLTANAEDAAQIMFVNPYELIVTEPYSFLLHPDEVEASGFELSVGKVVQVTKRYLDWVSIRVVTYDTAFNGDKWVPLHVLGAYDPSRAREGLLKKGASVMLYESGSEKASEADFPSFTPLYVDEESDTKYRIIAPGGRMGYINKEDFIPNPFDRSRVKAVSKWLLSEELQMVYEAFVKSKDPSVLAGLSPSDVFLLYGNAVERGDWDTVYGLFIKGEEWGTPSQEDWNSDLRQDPEGRVRSQRQWRSWIMQTPVWEQQIEGDTAYITFQAQGSPAGYTYTFGLTRNKDGIWFVNWLPMQ